MRISSSDFNARLVVMINEVNEADRLVELLDPRNKNGFTKAVVETILASKQNRPEKRFTEYRQIQELFANPKNIDGFVEDSKYTPCIAHPVLLLPLRLETRFTSKQLRVRIYPDQISIHSHETSLTQPEYDAARMYKLSESNNKDAWRILSSRFGPTRAAFIADFSKEYDFESDTIGNRPTSRIQQPKLIALPDRFWVFAYRHGNIIYTVTSNPVRTDSTVISSLDNDITSLFDDRSKWVHDFDTAVSDGFAVEIDLSPVDLAMGFDRIIAVGIKWTDPSGGMVELEKLLDAHHYSSGLGFVAPGTPTNNTNEVKSPYSSREEHDTAYEIEIEGPSNWEAQPTGELRTNAHRLADALGINPDLLRFVEGAGSVSDSYAADMNTVIWTVTGEYFLRHLLPGILDQDQLTFIRKHMRKFVRGGGPLPTLRIGRQPYGVLPVSNILLHTGKMKGMPAWSPWYDDSDPSPLDIVLYHVVTQFYTRWLDFARNPQRVPRIGVPQDDPDETLLRILSMEPRSVTYRARPFVDEGFIAWLLAVLRNYAFGSGSAYENSGLTPLQWMAKWSESWDSVQERIANLLASLSGKDAKVFLGDPGASEEEDKKAKPLLKILGWWDGSDEPIGMVRDFNDEATSPSEYLAEICQNGVTNSKTLLADMFQRALLLANKESDSFGKEIKEAICRLSSTNVLSFFNSVKEPEQIVQRIKDDQPRHPEREGYGVRYKLACRILEKKQQLGGQFSNLQQIDDIFRVGPDTMRDILQTFSDDKEQPDFDRLFRESLDLASHRVDAWVTSFATKRLKGIRQKKETEKGIHLGAYGFVEDLKPRDDKLSEGYFHTHSTGQAAAAAVLYNAYLTHDPKETTDGPDDIRTENPFHINLTSERVRKGLQILEGMRQAQPPGALIGYQFERALRNHIEPLEQYIDDFREKFPLVAHKVTAADEDESAEAVAARNVVDGVALIRDYNDENEEESKVQAILNSSGDHKNYLIIIIESVRDILDAVSDLLLTEGVYQAVQGNYERAGAALEAASGNLSPPAELESISTPVSGRSLQHRVGILFNKTSEDYNFEDDPRSAAEPRIAKWFESVLGEMKTIGAKFEFWEEETNPAFPALVNINTASQEELKALQPINDSLAQRIIEERSSERGLFKKISDLIRVKGIATEIAAKLKPLVTTGYIERVNVNRASIEELEELPHIGDVDGLATKIKNNRWFTCIDDLMSEMTNDEKEIIEQLRPYITTGLNTIGLDKLKLNAADFLYIAQVPVEGAETEIEQRLAQVVRKEFSLPATQQIEILADQSGGFENSLANAIELTRNTLGLLAAGTPMSPDSMCHPGDIKDEGYNNNDVINLIGRVENAQAGIKSTITKLKNITVFNNTNLRLKGCNKTFIMADKRLRHNPTDTIWKLDKIVTINKSGTADVTATTTQKSPPVRISPTTDWEIIDLVDGWESAESVSDSVIANPEEITVLLLKASLYGIPGSFSPGSDDPYLIDRYENTLEELRRRETVCKRLVKEAEANNNSNGKIKKLTKAMKALFGKSFIVLPTFVPSQPEEPPGSLNKALGQDILNGLGDERVRLWMQQAAAVQEGVAKLEDNMMMREAWSQTPSPHLKISQLPYTENRKWLGLSREEGAEEKPKKNWARSPLSLALISHGNRPIFSADTVGTAGNRTITSGIIIDEWNELIPSPKVNTSVAYQYDSPNAKAPQTLLLAISGNMNNPDAPWTPEALAEIVRDTADLAKVRSVDIDALAADPNQQAGVQPEPVGGILPGIYLPTDPDQPSSIREIPSETIEGWLEHLATKEWWELWP